MSRMSGITGSRIDLNMKKEPKTYGFGFLFHIASFHNAKLFHRGEKCIGFSGLAFAVAPMQYHGYFSS